MIDGNGDLHVTRILDGLDSLYGVSMTFQSLNAALCGLQQRQMESACTYYNRMAQITVILRECHGNRYRPGELTRMSKDCFNAGLLPENHPHGGASERPTPYHPPGFVEGPVGAIRKRHPNAYAVPTIHVV